MQKLTLLHTLQMCSMLGVLHNARNLIYSHRSYIKYSTTH